MAVTLPARRRTSAFPALARSALAWLALVLVLALPHVAHADSIALRSAELHEEDGDVMLSAEFDVSLNATLEEALANGIPLYFDLSFTLTRPRWYWLDDKVVDQVTTYRVAFAPLTRQYRVTSGLMAQSFGTLGEVERFLARVSSRPVARASELAKGTHYEAAVRLRLDTSQLPKPLQVSALGSRDWQLSSEWHRWGFTP
ncbi:MAG: DUF4390 domain-containing protein [Proteobacteria bacterium]|nr:DUF4390 domain-containing protein [Pseudomonadota bacterium]